MHLGSRAATQNTRSGYWKYFVENTTYSSSPNAVRVCARRPSPKGSVWHYVPLRFLARIDPLLLLERRIKIHSWFKSRATYERHVKDYGSIYTWSAHVRWNQNQSKSFPCYKYITYVEARGNSSFHSVGDPAYYLKFESSNWKLFFTYLALSEMRNNDTTVSRFVTFVCVLFYYLFPLLYLFRDHFLCTTVL